jgi:hypothetical protein
LVINSCREDTASPPVENQLFSLDSLSLWINPGFVGNQYTTYSIDQTISANTVRLDFTLQSNADSVHATGEYKDSTNGTPALPPMQFVHSPIDSQLSYTINVTTQPFYLSFYLRLIVSTPGSIPYYLRFRNIKLTGI